MKKAIIALMFGLIACNNSNSIPSDIIKPAQMQSIFWDMIRGDILAQEIVKKDSTQNIKNTGLAMAKKILAIHHIDSVTFEKSIAFYEKHPALMRVIFDSLSAVQTRKNYIEPETKPRALKDYHFPKGNKIP